MPETENWTLRLDAEQIAWLSLDKANASANVLSRAIVEELDRKLTEIGTLGAKGIVILSAKKSGFIAGADIKEFTGLKTPASVYELVRPSQLVFDRLESFAGPSVALIQGFALGGGLELALACTYRVGVDDGKLSLGLPEVQLGIHPGFSGTVRAVRLIGVRPAMQLMLTGKPMKADEALRRGLIDRLVKPEAAQATARELILSRPPRRRAPLAERLLNVAPVRPFIARQIEATVRARAPKSHYPAPYAIIDLWRAHGASGEASHEAEARSIAELMCGETSRNLVRVFLLQDRLKGLAVKSALDCKRLHVIGAGVMGGDIAAWAALRGIDVTLADRSEDLIRPALERAKGLFGKRLRDPQAAAQAASRLRADVAGAGVEDADIVIEAIFENAEAKRALYAELEPRLKPTAILATNTSSIMIETLAEKLRDPARLVGIHFFNPVAQMQLIEIVKGAGTRAEVAQASIAFARKLDRLPLPCRSAPGFLVNRVLMPYINEAMIALDSGLAAQVIDRAGVRFGMPMGPIELADLVGLDVCLSVGRVIAPAINRPAPESLTKLVEAKMLGRKSGQGFYRWVNGKPVRTRADELSIPADLEDRLILPMVNEAVAILREKVVDDADLIDAGVIFGTGFAPFRGGPLEYAKRRGIPEVKARLGELEKCYGERFRPDAGWDTAIL